MSIFEKIEMEPIETDESSNLPLSSRKFSNDDPLTVVYRPVMKFCLLFLFPLMIFPLILLCMEAGSFFLETICIFGTVVCAWILIDIVNTRSIVFYPNKIVKYCYFGVSQIPTSTLKFYFNEQTATFIHGCSENLRERFSIPRLLISAAESADIVKYAHDIYGISPNAAHKPDEVVDSSGPARQAVDEFENAVSSYRSMAVLIFVFLLIALFVAGTADVFYGFGQSLPGYSIRLLVIAIAAGSFFLLKSWSYKITLITQSHVAPLVLRFSSASRYATNTAVVAVSVASLGLVLFLLFGNTLDLYIFLLVGALYLYDFHPKLTTWQQLAAVEAKKEDVNPQRQPMRSLQVSLALMGALALMSYGESTNYLYANWKDCRDDWGDGSDCRELPDSGGGHSGWHGRIYGPRYGSGGGRAPRAIGVATISRGGFGSLGSFHGSFGG